MKADLYSLTPTMMKIADNPTDPWLDESLRSQGLTPYKYGEFRGKAKLKLVHDAPPVSSSTPSARPATVAGVSQDLIDHLASKVQG